MTPLEKTEFENMKRELADIRKVLKITPTLVIIDSTVQIKGRVNADRVYTGRTGSYVELTT